MVKIAVALSGGADSTFAAYLLKQRYEVIALFALLAPSHSSQEVQKVKTLCKKLGLRLFVIDLRTSFKKEVIEYFKKSYRQGLTPNPCIICNYKIKFGQLLKKALELGAEKLATGHYARVSYNPLHQQNILLKGKDIQKDQSYFLAGLTKSQLNKALFPLGEWSKNDVKKKTLDLGFFALTLPESQEVCFIARDYRELFSPEEFPPGKIITVEGKIVGYHKGLYRYTIGQRRGLGVRLGKPYYVVKIDPKTNELIIGPKEYLYTRSFLIHKLNIIYPLDLSHPFEAQVKIRYRNQAVRASIYPLSSEIWKVEFLKPQAAVTPGQFAVLYQNDIVLGAGEILRVEGKNGF